MSIRVERQGRRYVAIVTPPHGLVPNWRAGDPKSARELCAELQKAGCHQMDIADAFYEANPLWLDELDSE